ncbi:acyltransferase [Haloplanus rallus]|jgi:maltose O-acetyltransferase|uniref:Acyltransferase n=1 Tax=Haloplanus rallus TaxID=1816183 RepID=A0A6B9F6A8_9EURY|nr:acyltransferase [Haloplanus rallus]QGX93881.1 acyltransferase [Haloplanus rallus]
MTKRRVSLSPEVQGRIDQFVESVDTRLASNEDTAAVVQEVLARLHGDGGVYDRWQSGNQISTDEQVRLDAYDPRRVTVKADHWAETDAEQFQKSKPLQWLWKGFDVSPLARDLAIGIPFRQMIANHLFAEAGEDLQLFHGITFSYGHNIEMGDRTVVHGDVLLDDRGELEVGNRVSIAEGATIHSHGHDIVDQTDVSIYRTVIEDDARLASDSMIGAGSRVGRNAMVGAKSVVHGNVPNHHVAVGTPAKSVKVKPGWESVTDDPGTLEDDREERHIEYTLSDDVERIDEFQRNLAPPDTDDMPDS